MFRALPAAILLGSALLVTAGCNREPSNYEVIMEVSATGGATGRVATVVPDSAPTLQEGEALPWRRGYVVEKKGPVSVEVTPAKGRVTCRLEIEGKEIAKVAGKDGEKVRCAGHVGRK